MANKFQKLVYYLSAVSPVLIVFSFLLFFEKSEWTEPRRVYWIVPSILLVVAVLLICAFNWFFKRCVTGLSIINVEGTSFKCIDGWLFVYVVTYLLPLSYIALGDVIWIVLFVVIVLLTIVFVFSDYVTPHPILFFKGFHFYELKVGGFADYIVISKKQIRNVKSIVKVSRVFEFLLIRRL